MSLAPKHITLFTDGACKGNPGPGGFGVILRTVAGGITYERESYGFAPETTNNRMELMAAIKGLESLKGPCTVDLFTDSKYVQQGITQWLSAWKKNDWRTSSKQLVKNKDLWERLDLACHGHTIAWHWVKGHAGHVENERADYLANLAIMRRSNSDGEVAALPAEKGAL